MPSINCLDAPQLVTNQEIEALTRLFLARYRLAGRPEHIKEVADRIYSIAVPAKFREACKEHYTVDLCAEYTGTFHPPTAIAEETVEFFAFGHPLFDAIVHYALDRTRNGFSAESALRVVYDNELAGYEGMQFNYLISSDGVRSYRKFVPVVLDTRGYYTEAISQRIATLPADERTAERMHVTVPKNMVHELKRQSRTIITTIAAEEFEAAEKRNLREFAEVHTKLRRMFKYRLQHQSEKLAERQHALVDAQREQQENRIRLMQGQINATHQRMRELENQCDNELAQLISLHELSTGIQLLNVAVVKVLSVSHSDT